MLIAGLIAFGFGLLEFLLDTLLFPAVFQQKYARVGLLALAKLALYGGGIAMLTVKFRAYAIPAGIGFGAGFLVFMIAYAVKELLKKEG